MVEKHGAGERSILEKTGERSRSDPVGRYPMESLLDRPTAPSVTLSWRPMMKYFMLLVGEVCAAKHLCRAGQTISLPSVGVDPLPFHKCPWPA